jgi:hypothetical protein
MRPICHATETGIYTIPSLPASSLRVTRLEWCHAMYVVETGEELRPESVQLR